MQCNTCKHILCEEIGGSSGSQSIRCSHTGEWHSSYQQCGVRCAFKLGWANLGKCHHSCCFETNLDSQSCSESFHTYAVIDNGATPEQDNDIFPSDCKRYVVNLDSPPAERWRHILIDYLEDLTTVTGIIDGILGTGFLASAASSLFGGLTHMGKVYYAEELEGIASVTGMPVGKIAMMQIAYEVKK